MENTQKTFTVKLRTTNTKIDRETIRNFINMAIEESPYKDDLVYVVDTEIGTLYNFLSNPMTFSYFIRKTKEDFLKEYPYFAEEYDFCLAEFNKDRDNALLTFLEETSTKELTEPYGLYPEDFSFAVGMYIKANMTMEEQVEFLGEVTRRGLKVEIY